MTALRDEGSELCPAAVGFGINVDGWEVLTSSVLLWLRRLRYW